MILNEYSKKQGAYFQNVRMDVVKYLPEGLDRVLEVGCGQGCTLEWLKNERSCAWVAGVEIDAASALKARSKLDVLYEGNIEDMDLPIEKGSLDAVLCPDVLEHLLDPWGMVKKLTVFLKDDGYFILSVPNIRHFKVLYPLLFKGEWEYQEHGILDRTHLRFFTKKTALALVDGMHLDAIEATGLDSRTKAGKLNKLTLGLFKSFFEFQYIIVARKIKTSVR